MAGGVIRVSRPGTCTVPLTIREVIGGHMEPRKAAGWLAGVVLAVAIAVGFWPHEIPLGYTDQDGTTTLSCGSAFSSDKDSADDASLGRHIRAAFGDELTPSTEGYLAQCDDAVTTPRIIALVLAGAAILCALYLVLTESPAEKAAAGRRSEDDELVDED